MCSLANVFMVVLFHVDRTAEEFQRLLYGERIVIKERNTFRLHSYRYVKVIWTGRKYL